MRLEIDVGNSRAKWRLKECGEIRFGEFLLSERGTVPFPHGSVDEVLISIVAAKAHEKVLLDELKSSYPQAEVFVAAVKHSCCGVQCEYEPLANLGVDRWLASISAYNEFENGVLVIDSGSALTADYIDNQGRHVGGYIQPGFRLLRSAIDAGTSRVNFSDSAEVSLTPGSSTSECVNNGVRAMLVGAINFAAAKAKEMGIARFILTGGDAEWLEPLLADAWQLRDYLVLDGLSLVYEARGNE